MPVKSFREGPDASWLHTWFTLWLQTANASALDMVFLDLVSRLVKGQHGIRSDLLDAKMMDVVFMKASRGLGLPVGSGASGLESAPLPNGRKGLSEYGVGTAAALMAR